MDYAQIEEMISAVRRVADALETIAARLPVLTPDQAVDLANAEIVRQMQQRQPQERIAGRWPPKDGDIYGSVPPDGYPTDKRRRP